jgi:hypothetical protein
VSKQATPRRAGPRSRVSQRTAASRRSTTLSVYWCAYIWNEWNRPPGDPVEQLLNLGFIAQRCDDAGRLDEFRREALRALAAGGRRAQVELLTSE